MKKTLISLILSSLMAFSFTPKATATFDESSAETQNLMITEYFENPIELQFDDSYICTVEADSDNELVRSLSELPSYMWGPYNANDGSSYIQIYSGTNVTFRGSTSSYGYVYCGTLPANIYYDPSTSTNNFSLTYSTYYTYANNTYTYHNSSIYIFGSYNSSSKTFTINGISYYYQ